MSTAPGSEPLSTRRREPAARLAERAGPCDPQDPQPAIPDDTPPDERPPATGVDPGAVPGPRSGTAAGTPGAHEVTVEADTAHGRSEHDTSARRPASLPADPAQGAAPAPEEDGRPGAGPAVAKTTAPRG